MFARRAKLSVRIRDRTGSKFDRRIWLRYASRRRIAMSTIHSHLPTVNAWLGPRSKPYDLIRIYAIGAVIAFFFLYFGNIRIENGASDYIELARTILND